MNDNDFKVEAIARLAPNVGFAYNEKDGIFQWESDTAKPTKDQIEQKALEVKKEYDAQEYARNRSSEYPTWQEQMDMQYWDAKNGTTTWQEAIEAVKTKYPKGE